jgi:inner membrane protein
MATILSHSVVGLTLATIAPCKKDYRFYTIMSLLPVIADLDCVGFVLRVPYSSLWGHRGMTHSILFSVFVAFAAVLLFERRQVFREKIMRLSLYFLAAISHPLLDACTNGGLGVAFFSPYDQVRYFFPWRPIQVSPLGFGFFTERGLAVLINEAFWIIGPCLVIITLHQVLRRLCKSSKKSLPL